MTRPNFCPNCAAPLAETPHGAQPFTAEGDGGWDCFCDACKWGGDILPDEEATVAQAQGRLM